MAVRVGNPSNKTPPAPRWTIYPGAGLDPGQLFDAVRSGELQKTAITSDLIKGLDGLSPPAIDQVLPTYDRNAPSDVHPGAFNPAYVGPFLSDVGKLETGRPVRFFFAGELDPVLVVFKDGARDTHWRYVVMPMRD